MNITTHQVVRPNTSYSFSLYVALKQIQFHLFHSCLRFLYHSRVVVLTANSFHHCLAVNEDCDCVNGSLFSASQSKTEWIIHTSDWNIDELSSSGEFHHASFLLSTTKADYFPQYLWSYAKAIFSWIFDLSMIIFKSVPCSYLVQLGSIRDLSYRMLPS